MKIQPRYYPLIIIAAFLGFLLLGILLGFAPRHGGGQESSLLQFASLLWKGIL